MKSASSRSAKQPGAKRSSGPVQFKTDRARLRSGVSRTATPEHPEAALRHTVRGIVRRGLKPQTAKAAISLRIEQDVLEWFKAQGPGYQTRMTAVLRAFRDASI